MKKKVKFKRIKLIKMQQIVKIKKTSKYKKIINIDIDIYRIKFFLKISIE